jgi:hypothetical protein
MSVVRQIKMNIPIEFTIRVNVNDSNIFDSPPRDLQLKRKRSFESPPGAPIKRPRCNEMSDVSEWLRH